VASRGQGACPLLGLVHGALVVSEGDLVLGHLHRLEVDHRDLGLKHTRRRLPDGRALEVDAAGLGVESVDEAAVGRSGLAELLLSLLLEHEREAQGVHGQLGLPREDLQHRGQEPLREEERRYPVQPGLFQHSLPDELDSLEQVLEPGGERLERGVRPLLPLLGHLVQAEAGQYLLEQFGHDGLALDGLEQLL